MKKLFDPSPIEPAHPALVKLQEDLYRIYSHIRGNFQKEIDIAFDYASNQIGFVVVTSIAVTMNLDKGGTVSGVIVTDDKQLQDTVFIKALSKPLAMMKEKKFPKEIQPGQYHLYLFWYEALKLKLRTDWIEPAHLRVITPFDKLKFGSIAELQKSRERIAVKPEVIEPVHWFDPWIKIDPEEAILINVIDEVYSDLRLIEKISKSRSRQFTREVSPNVIEPVHYLRKGQELELEKIRELLTEINTMLQQYGY
jgi:hypothetical protein